MKYFMVVLGPKNKVPDDGWNVAIRNVEMFAIAETSLEARKNCEKLLENKGLHMKAVYAREIDETDIR